MADDGSRPVVLVFPFSNQNVRADLRSLEQAGLLAAFYTTVALRGQGAVLSAMPSTIRARMARRVFDEVPPSRIRTHPARELARNLAMLLRLSTLTRHERGWASVDAVATDLDEHLARLIRRGDIRASAIYAYEDAALRSFEAARAVGKRRFYELPIGYWRAGLRLLSEESERQPDWAPTLQILNDSPEKQKRKDAELRAADHVVVPSEFVRGTLREHPNLTATIDVVPYGAPPANRAALVARARSGKLRLLYVGQLSQRKGLSYLFEAMHRLRTEATLTLVGAKTGTACTALDAELGRHEWLGTASHRRVLEIMAQHDVLVFPSLFEGFGLVILEAMAQGLPVIATPNTAGPAVITEGEDGFVVPIRDADAITDRVHRVVLERDRLLAMSEAALRKAERMSWSVRSDMFVTMMLRRLGLSR